MKMRDIMKLVESTEQTITAYHSSSNHDITSFRPMTHFGTFKSAEDRMRHHRNAYYGTIYEVRLHFKNVYRMGDEAANNPKDLLRDMRAGLNRDLNFDTVAAHGIEAAVREAGYDGVVYKNIREDAGSDSWMIFSSDQAEIISQHSTTFYQGRDANQDITTRLLAMPFASRISVFGDIVAKNGKGEYKIFVDLADHSYDQLQDMLAPLMKLAREYSSHLSPYIWAHRDDSHYPDDSLALHWNTEDYWSWVVVYTKKNYAATMREAKATSIPLADFAEKTK
jgi:hypothetical protein